MTGHAEFRITRYAHEDEALVRYDESKFYELVLYIADAFRDDATFGRIKLAKLVFNSDFRAMRELGHPITGVTYIKDTWGHNPRELLLAELDLQAEDLVEIIIGAGEEEPRFIQHDERRRLIPRRGGDPEHFSSEELRIVDAVIEEYRDTPAKAMSDESHKTLGWQIADWKQEIPVESVSLGKPTERDLKDARTVAERLGLLE